MFKSEYYTTWEEYKKEHPEIADENLKTQKIQNYEEEMYKYILNLFM